MGDRTLQSSRLTNQLDPYQPHSPPSSLIACSVRLSRNSSTAAQSRKKRLCTAADREKGSKTQTLISFCSFPRQHHQKRHHFLLVMTGQDYCPSHGWSRLLSKS